jgi:hypothetical protein
LLFGNFYIPLNADAKHGWTIPIPRDGEKQFSTRLDALAFARKLRRKKVLSSAKATTFAWRVVTRNGDYLRLTLCPSSSKND